MADSENAYLFSVNFHGGYNLRFAIAQHLEITSVGPLNL